MRGQRVTAIRRRSSTARRRPIRRLRQLLDVVVGRPLDPSQVRSSIEHLVHLQRFATVDLLAEPAPGGVAVDRPADVGAAGRGRARRGGAPAVRRRPSRAPYASASAPPRSPPRCGRRSAPAQDVLGARGYLRPQIATRLDPTGRREIVTLVVTGDPGPRWQVGRIAITGMPADRTGRGDRALGFTCRHAVRPGGRGRGRAAYTSSAPRVGLLRGRPAHHARARARRRPRSTSPSMSRVARWCR